MDISFMVLRLLSDGRFHSGEQIGAALGVSRTAVWKQLSRWQERGLPIHVVPGKGYRWVEPVEWWDESLLRCMMAPGAEGLLYSLQVEQTVASTNTVIFDRIVSERMSGIVCLAEEQTAGRGRRGRQWIAPFGAGFYCSVGWCFDEGVAALEGLSLAVGLAVARVLIDYGIGGVGLKWPNDIMCRDAKMGGILIEMQMDGDGRCLVVVGIGINLSLHAGMQDAVGRPVADLQTESGRPLERNKLGAKLLEAVLLLLKGYGQGRFASMRDDWCRLDILNGKDVQLMGLAEPLVGIARGADSHGALLIDTPDGQRAISSGEVSLRWESR